MGSHHRLCRLGRFRVVCVLDSKSKGVLVPLVSVHVGIVDAAFAGVCKGGRLELCARAHLLGAEGFPEL